MTSQVVGLGIGLLPKVPGWVLPTFIVVGVVLVLMDLVSRWRSRKRNDASREE